MNKTRPKQLSFRVSEEEYRQLQEKILESGKNQQEYILSCVLEKQIVNTDGMEKEKREQESCTSCAYRKDWYCPVAGDRVKREGHCSEYEKSEIAKEK